MIQIKLGQNKKLPDRPSQNRPTEFFLLEICRHLFFLFFSLKIRFAENSVF